MITLTEAEVEQAALAWLGGLGWQVAHGPEIAPYGVGAERVGYGRLCWSRCFQFRTCVL